MNRREFAKCLGLFPFLGVFGFKKRVVLDQYDDLFSFISHHWPIDIAFCDSMYLSSDLWSAFLRDHSSFNLCYMNSTHNYFFKDLPMFLGRFKEGDGMVGFRFEAEDGSVQFHCFHYPDGKKTVHEVM